MSGDDPARLWELLEGATNLHLLRAFITLGLADAIASEGSTLPDLARLLGLNANRLERFLRAAEGIGLCQNVEPGRWILTAAGQLVRGDTPSAARVWALLMTAPWMQAAWCRLPEAVRGESDSFTGANGFPFWEYLAAHEEAERLFDEAMAQGATERASVAASAIANFDPRAVVDVGGGDGSLLVAVLESCPNARGVLADRPATLAHADRARAHNRIELVESDFLVHVPSGGDVYLLSRILHDHDDSRAARILQTCRAAMSDTSRLLILESVLPPWVDLDRSDQLALATKDLNMLVLVGGQERTLAEYQVLLRSACFTIESVMHATSDVDIITAICD
jgi:hypothetical protein